MKNSLFLILPLVLLAATASAQVKPFKVICIEEKSTGYNWKSGNWVQTNFIARDKFTIQKIDTNVLSKDSGHHMFCGDGGDVLWKLSNGCYQFNELGEKPSALNTRECSENFHYSSNDRGYIDCPGGVARNHIIFKPDGEFVSFSSSFGVGMAIQDGSAGSDKPRDSITVSVGKCSVISD